MEEENNVAVGEKYISAIKDTRGDIQVTFLRIYPSFRIIHRSIPMESVYPDYMQFYSKMKNSGIELSIMPNMFKVKDYFKFIKFLFPEFDVEDWQKSKENGRPDFCLTNSEGKFYIEFKSQSDGIRLNQLNWIQSHKEGEVWFSMLGAGAFTGIDPYF